MMKKFTPEDYSELNSGMALAVFSKDGVPQFALEQGMDFKDMTFEQKEFAKETAEKMCAHEWLEFYVGKMEYIEDMSSLDLPVYVWAPLPEKPSYYEPADITEARNLTLYYDFYQFV